MGKSPAGHSTVLSEARRLYHAHLIREGVLAVKDGVASNADGDNALSKRIATSIAKSLEAESGQRLAGQTSGIKFEAVNAEFLRSTFLSLPLLGSGTWGVEQVAGRDGLATIARFQQYAHLLHLRARALEDPVLASALGLGYTISPDIVVFREPLGDHQIEVGSFRLGKGAAARSALRSVYTALPILHAVVSAKWTIRSDRSQNSRTEALTLIRNRTGRLPGIVVVTAEPLPSRLASLALGTGDIDCVYHFALAELRDAVRSADNAQADRALGVMISGGRLKDISDLPLDLAV